jgi:membrane-associated phospholipid phosphatase
VLTSERPAVVAVSPRARLVARVVSEVCAPAVCGVVGLVAVAIHNTGSGAGAAWGGLAAIFVCGLPMAFVLTGVRDGRWDDHHVADRSKRALPLLVALVSVIVGALLLVTVQAPRDLVALVLTVVPELVIAIAVSHWWKISIHAAVLAGLVGVLIVLYGAWALLGLPLVALVAWSRKVLDAHTWPQVWVGAALGWGIAVVVFALLR